MTDYLNLRTCPACQGDKQPGIIICLDCWPKLREDAKKALKKPDVYAIGRRKEFYRQIDKGYKIASVMIPVSKEYEREPVKSRGQSEELPGQLSMSILADATSRKNVDEILPG